MAKILGVITARGGSKGIPGKNIKPLLGKPLIAYTTSAAKASGVFDRLILSTDDEGIARVAREYGCEVPFMRPAELAADKSPHLPVMVHAVKWMKENENYEPDYVAILQPTAPLRQAFHIREAVDLLIKTGADSVLGVAKISHAHPLWALKISEQGLANLFVSGEPVRKRIPARQMLPPAYIQNGSIYIFKPKFLFDPVEPSLYGDKVAAYIMDDQYNVNIDNPEDWDLAEKALLKLKTNK